MKTPEERLRIHCDHNQETYCQFCLKDVVLRAERTHPAPLDELVYIPGHWKCPDCGFYLVKSILHPNGISADRKTPDHCPNDGTEMLPVTWKQNAQDGRKGQDRLMERINELEDEKASHPAPEVREALRNMLEHYEYIPCDSYYAEDTKKVNNEAKAALLLPGLEAVECQTCLSESDYVKRHCPQRCDKGRVWVRKS